MTLRTLPFPARMLVREWRGGEIALLFFALLLGVSMVTGISLFAERLQNALVGEASSYLGGDRVLQLSEPLSAAQQEKAAANGLTLARTALFPTMAYPADSSSERMVLSALKAVSDSYPLRGELIVLNADGSRASVRYGPAPGNAWVDNQLLLQLDLQIGDAIELGNQRFAIDRVVLQESDAGSSFYGMGTRVMINDADLPQTGLLMPGSRVEYRYLFTGNENALDTYFAWLKPQLPPAARVMTLGDNQPGIAGALDKAGTFLRLAGSLGVLLAALAAGFAAQRYSERHVSTVATLKTLGAGRRQVMALLAGQMGMLWLLATAGGFAIGALLQLAFLKTVSHWLPAALPSPSLYPFALGAATSLICTASFVAPSFWKLAGIPPWRVLRIDHRESLIYHRGLLLVIPGMVLLLWLYSGNLRLVSGLLAAIALLLVVVGIAGMLLLQGGRKLGSRAGSPWRLGLANVMRRRWLSLLQVAVFATGFMLLGVIIILRTSLLDEWEMQLPADAPNVFLINVAPEQVQPLNSKLQALGFKTAGMHPMVRGRLTAINGSKATDLFDQSTSEVYRELNLSWANELPPDNLIVQGNWPGTSRDGRVPVSIESGLAQRLHVQPGDRLSFTIGDSVLECQITSVRTLDWDRMTPNFYFLFPSGVLEKYHTTWMTSLHRDKDAEATLQQVLRHYPTVTAYPVDDIISRIHSIVDRASLAVELILLLVLTAGVLVLLSSLRASLDQRMHEAALLRTLGASGGLVTGSLAIEFLAIGLVAGILASAGAEFTCWLLQSRLFRMEAQLHPQLWLLCTAGSAGMITASGLLLCRKAVTAPPLHILRQSGEQG